MLMGYRLHLAMVTEQPQVIDALNKKFECYCYCDLEYVGHESYHAIWAEFDRRKAVVFLHGSQIPSSTPFPHEFLGIPITEVCSLLPFFHLLSLLRASK